MVDPHIPSPPDPKEPGSQQNNGSSSQQTAGPVQPLIMNPKRTVKQVMACIWLYLGAQILLSLAVSGILTPAAEFLADGNIVLLIKWIPLITALTLFLVTLGSGLSAYGYGSKALHVNAAEQLQRKFDWSWVLKGFSMVILVNVIGSLFLVLVNFFLSMFSSGVSETSLEFGSGIVSDLLSILTVVFIAPALEELVMRGVICRSLCRFSKGFAAVFSALLFALLHMNLSQGLPVFAVGLMLGFVYVRSGSLMVCICVHMLNNLTAILLSQLEMFPDMWISLLAGLFYLIVCGTGVFFLWTERKEVLQMLKSGFGCRPMWHLVKKSAAFWLFVCCYIVFVLFEIFAAV